MLPCSSAEQSAQIIQGTVKSILNHGTIIQMLVITDEGRLYPVNLDHRMFFSMWEDLGRANLKGQRIIIHGEQFIDQRVEFPDLEDI
jgi:hypothetical protein